MLRVSIIAIIFLLYIVFTLSVGSGKYLPHINYIDFSFISKHQNLLYIAGIRVILLLGNLANESDLPRG